MNRDIKNIYNNIIKNYITTDINYFENLAKTGEIFKRKKSKTCGKELK